MATEVVRRTGRKGQPRDILTKAQRAELIAAYEAGDKYRVIAERFGVTDSALWGILSRRGITRTRHIVTDSDLDHARDFCSEQRRIRPFPGPFPLEENRPVHGRRRTLAKDENAFDVITPESAYWVGVLLTDGCVRPGSRGYDIILQLQAGDRAQVEAFKLFLRSDHAITDISTGRKQHYRPDGVPIRFSGAARIAVASWRLSEILIAYGVTPRKSLTARVNHLEMHPDFWRGVIDGDGSIRAGPKGGLRLFGSCHLIDQFVTFAEAVYPKANVAVAPRVNIFTASVNGKTAAIIIYCLYYNQHVSLKRKQEIAIDYLSRYGL